jgi:hypothetical protein
MNINAVPIYTLDARDNIILDALSGLLRPDTKQLRDDITGAHQELIRILAIKGVEYESLRWALSPHERKLECAFFFEVEELEKISMGNYAALAGSHVLPLLNPDSTCSILTGQLWHPDNEKGLALLDRYLQTRRSVDLTDVHQLFCIYLNNLTPSALERINTGLSGFVPYVGHVSTTTSSPMKDWLSVVLVPAYVKAKRRMVAAHEGDVPNEENRNLPSWPLEKQRYDCLSLQDIYYNLFLSYKIERAPDPVREQDSMYGLIAISDLPLSLNGLGVLVEEPKLKYLQENKHGSLETSGISKLGVHELQALISSKMKNNYIYNLRFNGGAGVSLFNIIIEVTNPARADAVRLMVGLEYRPSDRLLRLTTLI